MKPVLMPLPSKDFDPTESGVPWQELTLSGIEVIFATPDGQPGQCDPIMLTGKGLGLLAPVLAANQIGKKAYMAMSQSSSFRNPITWNEANVDDFEGIILAGGHAKGMREYLESTLLQNLVSEFFAKEKAVGAICHGTVLAARSKRTTGKSVLFGRKTTCLLESQELLAYRMTCLWMKDYYLTYNETVEHEVRRNLARPVDFVRGPTPLLRDSPKNLKPGFALRDGNYVSARWPGDAHHFTKILAETLNDISIHQKS